MLRTGSIVIFKVRQDSSHVALLTTQKKIVGPAQFELDLEVRIKRAGRPPWFSIFTYAIL